MCNKNNEKPLPKIADDFILSIARKSSWWLKVRREVRQELTDHFTDALHEFTEDTERQQVAEHLIEQFGQPKVLAKLIKKSKKRCRPLWLKVIRKTLAVISIFIIYLLINFSINYLPTPMPEFSRNTTYLENPPIDEYGMVDYVGWINEQNSKGVTPQNNMMAGFAEVTGVEILSYNQALLPAYLKALGVKNTPKGIYISSEQYEKDNNITKKDIFHDLTGRDMRPWTAEESPQTLAYLNANKKAMTQLAKIIDRPKYYSPLISEKNNAMILCLLPSLNTLRQTAKLFACRSNLYIAQGKLDKAWADAVTMRKLGLHLFAKEGTYRTLIEQLVGIAISQLAAKQANKVLASSKLTLIQAESFASQWTKLAPPEFNIKSSFLGERFFILDTALRISQGQFKNIVEATGYIENSLRHLADIRPNATVMMRTANKRYNKIEHYGDLIMSNHKNYEYEISSLDNYDSDISELIIAMISPQPYQQKLISKALVDVLLPSLSTVFIIIKAEYTHYDLVKVGLALRIYQLENGQYPEKLDALPAELLKKYNINLIDPFSGQLYKYNRTDKGFKIYSCGKNYKDDGGEDFMSRNDIVVEVPCIKKEPVMPKKISPQGIRNY